MIASFLILGAVSFLGFVVVFILGEIRDQRKHKKLIADLDAMRRGEACFQAPRKLKDVA